MKAYELGHFEKALLFLTGLSMPLVRLRLELPILSLSLYVFSILLLLLYNGGILAKSVAVQKQEIPVYLFLIITLASTLSSEDIVYGIVRWTKLLLVIILYFGMKTLFTKKPGYVDAIMRVAVTTVPMYLMYLAWFYIGKYELTYIAPTVEFPTRMGKNSLSFVVAFVMPFSIGSFFSNERGPKWGKFRLAVFMATLVGTILIQSRAMYILAVFYAFLHIVLNRVSWSYAKKALLLLVSLLTLVYLFAPTPLINTISTRFHSIGAIVTDDYVASEYSGVNSIDTRAKLISKGLSMFGKNPILGTGMGSFMFYGGGKSPISHNDYILVLAEQGMLGFIVFASMIGYFVFLSYRNFKHKKDKQNLSLFMAMSGLSMYLFFINAYDNVLLWTAMAMVTSSNTTTAEPNSCNADEYRHKGGSCP